MPLVIEQRFPLGRFHATRRNQSPFEDQYGEWPPSPWRLIRALASRWFQYVRETGDSNEKKRNMLFTQLTRSSPAFILPPLTRRGPVLRQYQPTEVAWTDANKKATAYKKPKTTLIEDHCHILAPDAQILWYWPAVELPAELMLLLDSLLQRILYFGRAESYCIMRRLDTLPENAKPNCILLAKDAGNMSPVLVSHPEGQLNLESLLSSTDNLSGHPIPPGTAWYYAKLPEQPPLIRPAVAATGQQRGYNCIQFTIGSHVNPPIIRWVKLTERFRGRVLKCLCHAMTGDQRSHYGTLTAEQRSKISLISGKDAYGKPTEGHHHAYFLLWPDENNHPTRLVVWRRKPFTAEEVMALLEASILPISWENTAPEWSVRLVPLPSETPPPFGLVEEARIWQSATPFVPPTARHRFRNNGRLRNTESPERIATKLIQSSGKSMPSRVTKIKGDDSTTWMNLHETRERRQQRRETRTPLVRPGFHLKIEFENPVTGPLIIGDSSHFGLGLFVPEMESNPDRSGAIPKTIIDKE